MNMYEADITAKVGRGFWAGRTIHIEADTLKEAVTKARDFKIEVEHPLQSDDSKLTLGVANAEVRFLYSVDEPGTPLKAESYTMD